MALQWVRGGVTAAAGFRAAGMAAGIKADDQLDLALVIADELATTAAVFTENRVQAAPVVISKKRVRSGKAQAIVLNSGNANCLIWPDGVEDALAVGDALAEQLAIEPSDVLFASTGIIGRRLPAKKIVKAIDTLVEQAQRAGHTQAAEAILTTDTASKEAAAQANVYTKRIRVGGMAKGAGMIAPSMATMLCVITTDVEVEPRYLKQLLQRATASTFNRISVDGDMSTNDTVFILASGASGVQVKPGTAAGRTFYSLLEAVM